MDIIIQLLIGLLALFGGTSQTAVAPTPKPDISFSYVADLTVDGFDGKVWVCDPSVLGFDPKHISAADAEALKRIALNVHNDAVEVCYFGHDEQGNEVSGT